MLGDKSHYCILSTDGWAVEQCETGSKKEKVPGIYEEVIILCRLLDSVNQFCAEKHRAVMQIETAWWECLHRVRGRVTRGEVGQGGQEFGPVGDSGS